MTTGSLPVVPEAKAAPAVGSFEAASRPEADLLDHEYDGIREYDNPLPGWWVAVLWASFFFSIGYLFHYSVGNGVSVEDSYAQEMAAARAEQAKQALGERVSEDGLQKLALDSALMGDAKTLFTQRCVVCHGDQGQGVIGPNLTDAHWLHGAGTLLDIHAVIADGVADKGMPAWKLQLSPVQVRQLAAFVGQLRGRNLPGKAPEGKLVSPAP
ncbi:MAG TPA: cbb3-type cytochrome c oxidase N-terminal domain-containing protein [Polyangiaceae bacterium]